MRKSEKIELEKTMYGLSLPQCGQHHLPLVYHVIDFFEGTPWSGSYLEGCWDCPIEGCEYHVHEPEGKPWTPIGTGETEQTLGVKNP